LPVLGEKFTVIAPDLPGIGDSSIPATGINMTDAATSIHSLMRKLGIEKARIVGHDIGLMVAYAYAAQFPSEVQKLAVMDACLPGVEGWEPIITVPPSGIFDSTGRNRKRWSADGNKSTFHFLGRSGRRQEPFTPRGRPQSLYRRVFPTGAHESSVAILRLVAADR
jgi:pimeloyl-ACP methyl ester carboxylesterase